MISGKRKNKEIQNGRSRKIAYMMHNIFPLNFVPVRIK